MNEFLQIKSKFTEVIHPLLFKVFSGVQKYNLKIDGAVPDKGNYIYIANHFGVNDIPTAAQIIQKHVFALVSNEDRHKLDGLFLELNGVIWTSRTDKSLRKKSKNEIILHLRRGENVLMYPEATWNNSPNLLMLPMNYGCITISQETAVPIVPLYLFFHKESNTCYVKIHKPFVPSADSLDSINKLRDIMATTAFNYMEKYNASTRAKIVAQNFDWDNEVKLKLLEYRRSRKNPDAVRKTEEQYIFKPKNIIDNKTAFSHLNIIDANIKTAFLFNKRLF